MVRILIYFRQFSNRSETEAELLRKAVEDRGDTVIACFADDPSIFGKGKNAGWNAMLRSLEHADQVIVASAADLPGRKVTDLLKILAALNDHGVSLYLVHEGINSDDGPTVILDLIIAYRAAKLSDAIRLGISKARMAGKVIGRPTVPGHIRRTIQIALADGDGIRHTARRFGVSAASVINIRRMMDVEPVKLAA
jgi:DNA invertase Pin-like site-specific DNA recombinase